MSRAFCFAILALASCVPDCDGDFPAPGGGAGHGGATAATVATSASSADGAGGAPAEPACVAPAPRHDRCASASDCWDGSPCTVDACETPAGDPCPAGAAPNSCVCRWADMPNGTRCDPGLPGRWTCIERECCPVVAPRGAVSP